MTNSKNPPVDHVRLGAVQAAIWRNETENGPRYAATFERRYFDAKADDWKSSSSFNRDDLPILGRAADMAFARIHELQAADRAAGRQRDADDAPDSETESPPPADRAGGASAPAKAARAKSRSGSSR